MPFYDNTGQVNDEAINIVNGRSYQVVQLADTDGNVVNLGGGSPGGSGSLIVSTIGPLTSPGTTTPVSVSVGSPVTFQVTVTSIGINVVIRLEGTLDNTNYFNLDANEADYTLTANGIYGYLVEAPLASVRLRLVSVSGGTPSVSCKVGMI